MMTITLVSSVMNRRKNYKCVLCFFSSHYICLLMSLVVIMIMMIFRLLMKSLESVRTLISLLLSSLCEISCWIQIFHQSLRNERSHRYWHEFSFYHQTLDSQSGQWRWERRFVMAWTEKISHDDSFVEVWGKNSGIFTPGSSSSDYTIQERRWWSWSSSCVMIFETNFLSFLLVSSSASSSLRWTNPSSLIQGK